MKRLHVDLLDALQDMSNRPSTHDASEDIGRMLDDILHDERMRRKPGDT